MSLASLIGADRNQSTLGGRHHVHPLGDGVRVPGGGAGCLLAARRRLGVGPNSGRRSELGSTADGLTQPQAAAPGLVHHSDRGIQYASCDYTKLLKDNQIRISMSRKGNPYDNATCESFMKTLKYEEVYRQEYRDLREARASVEQFIGKIYNQKRLHSALGYRPPAEFERALVACAGAEVRA